MNSSSSKNPKKKRRIDVPQESLPGPSSYGLDMCNSHSLNMTAKDISKDRRPFPKGKSKHHSLSSPQFVKASELYKKMNQNIKREKSNRSEQSTLDNVISNKVTNDFASISMNSSTDSKSNYELANCEKLRNCHGAVGNCTPGSMKITRYFKTKNLSKTHTTQTQSNPKSAETESTTGSSGWKNKDKRIVTVTELNNEQFFKKYFNCYELIHDAVIEKDGEDYFSNLPTHIIETILCQIPILDLMTSRLVCTRWHDIIDNSKFMEWKKMYYKFKVECKSPVSAVNTIVRGVITSLDYQSIEGGIPTLVKYMGKQFNRLPSEDMYELLMQNAKGELADQVISERFPEWNGKETRVWCQFAIAILISETVWDIFDLYKSMFTSKASCSRPDVIDAMYCVATFLLYYRTFQGINSGLHYRLYYVLYLIENHVPKIQREKLMIIKDLPGQQSMRNYSKVDCSFMTYEQIRILNHRFDMHQKIRIIALAGTGKTTTLLQLSRLYPQMNFLNIVFNKSVNEEAKKKFPQNVTCKTAHSLAYAAVGRFLRHKLTTTLRPYDLMGHLKHNEDHMQIYIYAHLVLTTINNFALSSSTVMSMVHVPRKDCKSNTISLTNRDRILMDAFKIWQKMVKESDPFKITHDIYLKLYHLKQPKLNMFHCVMVDEAQDCNPAILDVVLSQTMPVIFVGDPNQQVYGFRGAQNALQNINATHTYHLTKSFRFGPEISYIASCILELTLQTTATTIVGSTNDSFINGKACGQYAVISRSNVSLFNEAIRMIVFKRLKRNEPSCIHATFTGGINSYGFDQISDIYKLKHLSRGDMQLTDKFISKFKTYVDLYNYAKYSDDKDLISKIEIVNQYGDDISNYIAILKEKCNHPMELANVVFSNTHKAKGLEFDTVYLTDDYHTPSLTGRHLDVEPGEENILYVAVTRAKRCLLLPERITKIFHLAYEKFEYPVSSKSILQARPALNCVMCNDAFTPHTVLLFYRRKIVMASEREIEEGPLCMKCGSDPYMRPDVHMNGLILYLDSTNDNSHRFMSCLVGSLPNDPPIIHDRFTEFQNADRVFVINLNVL